MNIPENGDMCWNCAFYQHRIDLAGECHRAAPTTFLVIGAEDEFEDRAGCWPTVDETDWCGEFRPAPMSRLRERDYIERVFQERSGPATAEARIDFRAGLSARIHEFRSASGEK